MHLMYHIDAATGKLVRTKTKRNSATGQVEANADYATYVTQRRDNSVGSKQDIEENLQQLETQLGVYSASGVFLALKASADAGACWEGSNNEGNRSSVTLRASANTGRNKNFQFRKTAATA